MNELNKTRKEIRKHNASLEEHDENSVAAQLKRKTIRELEAKKRTLLHSGEAIRK